MAQPSNLPAAWRAIAAAILASLMPTQPVRAQALAGWRLDDYRVTAVRLANTSKRWITLDPRDLQEGDFATGTFQHDALGPAGTLDDTTVVYLVTKGHSLAEALLPVIGRIDARKNRGRAECPWEAELSARATARLRQLVASGQTGITTVACACPPGTEGTPECNHGRSCGTLTVNGRDVGDTLVAEGLAVQFVCSGWGCPPTPRPWCD